MKHWGHSKVIWACNKGFLIHGFKLGLLAMNEHDAENTEKAVRNKSRRDSVWVHRMHGWFSHTVQGEILIKNCSYVLCGDSSPHSDTCSTEKLPNIAKVKRWRKLSFVKKRKRKKNYDSWKTSGVCQDQNINF